LTKAWLNRAEGIAKRAALFSQAQAESARADAELAIAHSRRLVDVGHAFASVVPLQRIERRRLADSKVSLAEAQVLFREGSYLEAASRARSIQDLVQGVVQACSSKAGRYTDRSLIQKWRTMIDDTIDWSRRSGDAALVVFKAEHKMTLYVGGKAVKTYRTDIGFNNVADKLVAGDGATPEGRYKIIEKKGSSTYYRALLLNYPNEEDERQLRTAKASGRIARSAGPGGLIEIHGEGGRGDDWTKGCVAISNREMDDLFARVGVGTPVTIVGSDGDGGLFVHLMRQHESVMSTNHQ
jgi:L,D-peptidoglycan transpeptidase YkuD (ErfK/YbiS/YcfS/YnhG family)